MKALAALLCDAPASLAAQIMPIMLSMVEIPGTRKSGSEYDIFGQQDPRMCSALLRNPAFINPWLTFIFSNAAEHPETKLESAALMALDFFVLLLGENFDLDRLNFESVPEFTGSRCACFTQTVQEN